VGVANADVAWIDVLPSARQFLPKLTEAVQPAARTAGEQAGRQFGSSFGQTSTSAVEKASSQMSAALRKVQDATGQVQVAEAKLQALRDRNVQDAGRLAAAEEAVARARRGETAANEGLSTATRRVAEAQQQHATAASSSGQAMEQSEKKAGLLSRTFGSLQGAVVAGFAAFGAAGTAIGFVKDTIGAASDLNETVNKATVIFGSNMTVVDQWSRSAARNLGLSRAAALDTAAGFGNMYTQLGFSADAAAQMSIKTVQMAADLGSFNNLPTADVADMISGAFRGEYDSLQQLIPNISAARVEQEAMTETGKTNADSLTAQEKAAAVLAIVQRDGAAAMGDFQRTSGGLANQQKILSATWDDMKARLGQLLLGPMTGVTTWITTSALPWLAELGNTASQVFGILFNGNFTSGGWLSADSPLVDTLFNLRDALKQFWAFLTGSVFPALQAFGGFIIQSRDWLGPLVGIVVAVVGALKLWTAVQLLLNLAMDANPIGILITAVKFLVVGFGIAWASSETFRNIVTAALHAVADAASWMWNNVLKPTWDALVIAYNAVAAAIQWAWQNVIKPSWDAVSTAAQWLWNNVLHPIFTAISAGWQAMVTAIEWYWNNILMPVWNFIQTAATVMFRILTVLVFAPIALAWEAMTTAIGWAWDNVLKPTWDAVSTAAQWLWNNILSPVFAAIGAGWSALLTGVQWAWENVLKPVWDAVSTAASWLWNNILKPIFDAIGAGWSALMTGIRWAYDNIIAPMWGIFSDAVNALKTVFDVVVEGIDKVWNTIMDIVATPINFVIEIVFNRGLFTAWNWIVDHLGLPSDWKAPHWSQLDHGMQFAQGGPVRGHSPSKTADNIPARLTAGEYVQPVDSTRFYGVDAMEAIRQRRATVMYAAGGQVAEVPGFADGGMTWNALWETVHTQPAFKDAVLTSAYRAGANDYHGKGQAIDVSFGGNPQSRLIPLAAWIAQNFPNSTELIHNPNGSIKNGKQVPPSFWGLATWLAHMNHVHWAMTPEALAGAGGPGTQQLGFIGFLGDVWNVATDVLGTLQKVITEPVKQLKALGDNTFVQMVAGAPGKMLSGMWDAAKGAIEAFFAALVSDATPAGGDILVPERTGSVVDAVKAVFATMSWGSGSEWAATDWIVNKESGWNPNAQNPTSTASGLFQHIDSTWRANRPASAAGKPHMKNATATEQGQAGMKYITRAYGDPLAAKSFWVAHNYYGDGGMVDVFDRGGVWRHGHVGVNLSGDDERVLTAPQDDYFQRFVRQLEHGEWGGGKRMLAEKIEVHGRDADDIIGRLWNKMRVADRGGVYTFAS
jgi:hypothetical protein